MAGTCGACAFLGRYEYICTAAVFHRHLYRQFGFRAGGGRKLAGLSRFELRYGANVPSIARQVCAPQSPGQSAVIVNGPAFPQGGGSIAILQGSLLFEGDPATPNHVITLHDSQQQATLANNGRLAASANDVFIGTDDTRGTFATCRLERHKRISFYIGNTGDNLSYLERLTAALKTFNVPVKINGNLTVTGTCTGCGGGGSGTVNSGTATQVAMYAANGAAVSGDSGLTDNGTTLNYAGSNGISATAGTFSGNCDGERTVAGGGSVDGEFADSGNGDGGGGSGDFGAGNLERWELLYFRERGGAAEGGDDGEQFVFFESVSGRCERFGRV